MTQEPLRASSGICRWQDFSATEKSDRLDQRRSCMDTPRQRRCFAQPNPVDGPARTSSELRRVEPELFPFSDYPVSAQEGLHIATLEERTKRPGNRYRPHRHDFYQIFWLTRGERSFTIDFDNF